jgi:uroporphyrin-III C-methyltransferase
LNKGDVGRKWVVEEGFKGFDDFCGFGVEELVLGEKGERPERILRVDSYS